jgi:hypothetical protein
MGIIKPEMDKPIIAHGTAFLLEIGISFGVCVLGIALLNPQELTYLVQHISPGNIVTELSSMLNMSADGRVIVYQSNVSGIIKELAAGTGTVYTSIQAIKAHFINRDRRRGGLS